MWKWKWCNWSFIIIHCFIKQYITSLLIADVAATSVFKIHGRTSVKGPCFYIYIDCMKKKIINKTFRYHLHLLYAVRTYYTPPKPSTHVSTSNDQGFVLRYSLLCFIFPAIERSQMVSNIPLPSCSANRFSLPESGERKILQRVERIYAL